MQLMFCGARNKVVDQRHLSTIVLCTSELTFVLKYKRIFSEIAD